MIQVLLADNQAIFRAGTARVLSAQDDISVVAQCDAAEELLDMVTGKPASVLVMAESLRPDLDRVFAATTAVSTRVILMTDSTNEPPPNLLRRIEGLLTRHASTADLLQCVRLVGGGERAINSAGNSVDSVGHRVREVLTARELQIVGLVVQGWKNRQIADELGTKEQVVKNYLRSIYDKTGSSDRLELALFTLHHRVLAEAAAKATEALQLRTV